MSRPVVELGGTGEMKRCRWPCPSRMRQEGGIQPFTLTRDEDCHRIVEKCRICRIDKDRFLASGEVTRLRMLPSVAVPCRREILIVTLASRNERFPKESNSSDVHFDLVSTETRVMLMVLQFLLLDDYAGYY
jgi:hypothetical protein